MKKLSAIIFILFGSMNVQADQIDDLFAGGENNETGFERFSENNVMEAISHDAGVACHKGLCTFSSVDTKFKEFSINLNGGVGNTNPYGGYGGFGTGNGTIITFPGGTQGNLSFKDRLNAGVNMQLKIGTCTRSVNIPRSLYYSINR